jgi:hypothetical protein
MSGIRLWCSSAVFVVLLVLHATTLDMRWSSTLLKTVTEGLDGGESRPNREMTVTPASVAAGTRIPMNARESRTCWKTSSAG